MTSALTDNPAVSSGDAVPGGLRWRGKSKAANFTYQGPVAVIRLELDATDDVVRRRMVAQWEAVFRLRRALQRDAVARCRAYWAAHHERACDSKAVRARLGLSRKGIEAAAKRHIEGSKWMRSHLTKAVGLHVADEVWETIDRHLFADASGRRHGAPRVGAWFDFTRIPGRARSHTKTTPTWETYRLVGTLDGHLATYRHPRLSAAISTAAVADTTPAGSSILAQPARIPAVPRPVSKSWWDHNGALAVVFTGLPAGDLVLPVRLAQGAGQWPHLHHFLGNPAVWHKIDLVRVADRKAPGGWRYYAHLLVHQAGYQSASTRARRAALPAGRRAGVDANVSNLAVASFPHDRPSELTVARIVCTPEQQRAAARAAKRARDRQRALDRSRRNTNTDQYGPSVRQRTRAQRRTAKGLPAKRIANPGGARHARADGVPLRAYRRDDLSQRYRRTRSDHATHARRTSQAKQARAAAVAAQIVATHGNAITMEDCRIASWARLWGKRIALFSPGMLVAALAAECAVTGGRLTRAGTRTTAMSQHCLCGVRVAKTLSQRVHDCPQCGLHADRDIVSATLAACVEFADPDDPRTAWVDYGLARALRDGLASQQEWEGSVNRHQRPTPPDGVGSTRTGSHPPVASAEQAASGPPPNRPHQRGRHGTSRKQPVPKLIGAA
ncbi:Putative transposase DNA-binding domain [Mycobacteroides abscessus subsp. abscessus]|uniref:zinc ribbon domain-containing protein n=1 Tax=Mycobacteroides abscessus TaxID=36809 RepID=UPI00092661CC|nr:zinc ribbon domain-containing protein [Mycobacteroides abscessus]SHU67290.1 Putative transposase DNA-binding domain [Mycobacteroides abscessus subsp. abscessus]